MASRRLDFSSTVLTLSMKLKFFQQRKYDETVTYLKIFDLTCDQFEEERRQGNHSFGKKFHVGS